MTSPRGARPSARGELFLVAAAYLATARLGLLLASLHGNVSPFWPATGLAIAALVVLGTRAWPAILAGAFLVNALTPIPLWTAAAMGVGNTLEALIGAALVQLCRERLPAGRLGEVTGVVLAAVFAPAVSAGVGVSALVLGAGVPREAARQLALTWWAGDGIGALVTTPALLAVAAWWPLRRRPSPATLARAAGLTLLALGVCALVFRDSAGAPMLFLVFPEVLLATVWHGRLGAKLVTLGIVIFSVAAAHAGHGPFQAASVNDSLLLLELFLVALALTAIQLSLFHESGSLMLPSGILLLGWVLSGWLFWSVQRERLRADQIRMDNLAKDAGAAIAQRLTTYTDALRGGVGLFAAVDHVTLPRWRRYVASLDLARRYPGINGLGVVEPVAAADTAAFLARVRADGRPGLAIHPVPGGDPADPAAAHYVITLIEPFDLNYRALGLDVASEENRRRAAESSRDSGSARVTGRITLVQDGRGRPGFLLFLPVYDPGLPHATVTERRRAHRGWVYAPFITEHFLTGVLGARAELLLDFYEGTRTDPAKLLFTTATGSTAAAHDRVTHLELGGQPFTLGWRRGPRFTASGQAAGVVAGTSLALVCALLAGLVMSLQSTGRRAHALARVRTRELEAVNRQLQLEIAERRRAGAEAQEARAVAEAASRAKSEFLATMSHEIRTPMNSVIGFTELLLGSPLTEEQRGWSRAIDTSGRALLALINDILDFSRIEAGRLRLERVPFQPLVAVHEVLEQFTPAAAEKRLALRLDLGDPPPDWVLGDPGRFKQVLVNLAGNAIKFTERGSVRLRVQWHRPGNRITIDVHDTGIGIPLEKQGGLFAKFAQADSSTTRRYGGTGLGLAICRQLTGLMGGSISLRSQPGVGSCFTVELPLEPAEGRSPEVDAGGAAGAAPAAPLRVLVAEDVLLNQRLVAAMLARHGCEVELAENGRVAADRAGREPFDLILMDCHMPELDGFEATRAIRAREREAPAARRTPIVALTASAMREDRERCLAAGMDDYLTKPIRAADLERTLARWGAGRPVTPG